MTTLRPWLFRGALAAVGGGLVAAGDQGPVLCPFRLCTGGYCPGCGLTRAAGRLARGDLSGAWQQHPFLVIGVAEVAVVVAAWGLWRRRLARTAPRLPTPGSAGYPTMGPAAFLGRLQVPLVALNWGILIAIWIIRLRLGAIPSPFTRFA